MGRILVPWLQSGHATHLRVLDRLNPDVLLSLTFSCNDDIDILLEILPRFSALQELKLLGTAFDAVALPLTTTARPLALTSLTLHGVELSASAYLALHAFLANAPQLQTPSFEATCCINDDSCDSIASSCADWIRNGVREIDFVDCKLTDGLGTQLAYYALSSVTSPLGVKISWINNKFSDDDDVALLDALYTCTRIVLFLNCMSNAKRHAKAPTPVEALDHVQEAIVKCLETPDDVVAFLDALSMDALRGPLAALLRLLCEPGDDMWDAGAEAAALVRLWPSFAGLDHVLIGILKWLKTPQEVLAFLEGIDTPTLGKPLVALLRLLRDVLDVMKDFDEEDRDSALDKLWPRLKLDLVCDAPAGLVVDALPAFHAIEIGDPECVRAFGPSGHAYWISYVDAFAWFVDAFRHKMTHLKIDAIYYEMDEDGDVMCSVLRRCTNLDVVHVHNTPFDLAFVAAVTTPAHAVSSLSIVSDRAADEWAAVLEPWLQSGHATGLRYQNLLDEIDWRPRSVNVGNARILAAARSLSHLTVLCDEALDPLVDATPMRFEKLETLNMSIGRAGPFLESVLDRVNPAVLTSLTIFCNDDIDFLLEMLPCFLALQVLKLFRGVIAEDAQPPAAMARPLALTSLTLHDVGISASSFLALDALLANAPRLETLSFGSRYCRDDSQDASGKSVKWMLPGWIRNGVREIHLANCKFPEGFGTQLARALGGMTSPLGVTITLVGSTLSDDDYEALLDALVTCTRIDLFLDPDWPQMAIEAAKRNLVLDDYDVVMFDFDEIQPCADEDAFYGEMPKGRCDAVRVMRRP